MGNLTEIATNTDTRPDRRDLAPDESALLASLINGEGVAAAARAAGLSLRTAHRRLTLLRARRGVTTNAQLLQHETDGTRDGVHARATHRLTERQREVLELVGEGRTTQEIAVRLGITSTTVETHVRAAMDRLGAKTRRQASVLMTIHSDAGAPGRLPLDACMTTRSKW